MDVIAMVSRKDVVILAPPGSPSLPTFDGGWITDDGSRVPFLSYTDQTASNWSEDLELLHEEVSRNHFIDVWTRRAIVQRVAPVANTGTVVDLGCSTGYLLEDLSAALPRPQLVGVDLVASGLAKAHGLVPSARLLQADACVLPFEDACIDLVTSANLLEHVPNDHLALAEIKRVLRPGGQALIVVPAGPGTFDYYDRFLGHERRYAHGELARKSREAGLEVVEEINLGSLLYPAFWLVKKRNRRWLGHLEADALERRVAADIAATRDSRVGQMLGRVEERLRVRLPFGIRTLVDLRTASS
jgi:SAM-dependent methyltransferase